MGHVLGERGECGGAQLGEEDEDGRGGWEVLNEMGEGQVGL